MVQQNLARKDGEIDRTLQIPYFTMLISAGLPVFFLEILLGQYAGVGPIKTFGHLVPLLKGLGYVSPIFCI